MVLTYSRRNPLKRQQPAGGYAGHAIAGKNQHLTGCLHSHIKLEDLHYKLSSIFQNIPRSKRSKGRYLLKKMANVVDSDYVPHSRVPRKQIGSKHARNSQKRITEKRKGKADLSDSETYAPRLRVRGQKRALLHRSNSITQQGLFDTNIFQVYFENIWNGISVEKRNSFAYLDSLWFNMYTEGSGNGKVLNWITKKDIFSKKYVLVPIVMWSHWSLLILCHFGEQSKSSSPCMVLLDSLQSANHNLEPQIRKFVLEIYKKEDRPVTRESIQKIPFLVPKVPQQKNGEECGCYVLFYVSLFLENAPESFSISDGYPYFMKKDWFASQDLDEFCQSLGSVRAESSTQD
ncbi:hypothetical protein M9H77_13821 [Catharanthus roseus]|uniref:Uncharacterized protein n=1 Tax=Catharanthus roseus TaxID=4058 RepID=A0ACC0BLG6_CATRO|nr:hypothetical protein M9H77_13821 [Catharanthus roseus]